MKNLDSPFYHNCVFSKLDLNRIKIKWWSYPLLLFLPTYTQVSDGYAWHYKTWQGRIYLIKKEEI